MSVEIRTCRDCSAEFEIEDSEREWFLQRAMVLPLRCRDCRAKRRAAKQPVQPPAGDDDD